MTVLDHTPATDLTHEEWLHDERALLGHLMLDVEHINQVIQILPSQPFIDPRHNEVYELVSISHMGGLPKDVASTAECLPRCGDLAETLGVAGLYAMIAAAGTYPADRVLALALTVMERTQSGAIPPGAVEPVAASTDTHLPVSVPGGIIVFPLKGEQAPRCVALDRRARCRSAIRPGQSDYWVVEGHGVVDAMDGSESTPSDFIRQRCERHLDDGSPDAVAPEWEWFSPQRFPGLVRPHDRVWTPSGPLMLSQPAPTPMKRRPAVPPPPAAPVRPQADVPTILYWHYDADGALLYIGVTGGFEARGKAHAKGSSWVQFAKTSKSVWYPNRAEAEAAEVEAIKAERPLFNHVHNDSPEARERLVRYLIDRGRADLLAPAVSRG